MSFPAVTAKKRLAGKKTSVMVRLRNDLNKNGCLYLMLLPVVASSLVFHYYPMHGAQIAFKDFSPGL